MFEISCLTTEYFAVIVKTVTSLKKKHRNIAWLFLQTKLIGSEMIPNSQLDLIDIIKTAFV